MIKLISNKDLYDLIKSLSKSEKRFLKLHIASTKLPTEAVKLLDAIEKKTEYIDNIITNVKQIKEVEQTSNSSEMLYNSTLECLRIYYADSSATFIIKDEVTNILNLFDKAQYKQCRKILNKQKQEAYRFEKFYFILELIGLEKLLIKIETQFNLVNNTIEALIEEENTIISKSKNLGEYTLLFSKINLDTRESESAKTQFDFKELNNVLKSSLLVNSSQCLSTKALVIYHSCRVLIYQKQLDNKKRHLECEKIISIMEKNDEIIEEMPMRYLNAISHLTIIAYQSQKYKTCNEWVLKMRSNKNSKAFNTTDLQLRIFTSSYNAEISTYIDSAKFKEAKKLVHEIENGLSEFDGKISKEEVLKFYYNIALMYTYNADYIKAKEYVGKVLQMGDSLLRQDLQSFARILNICIHFELNDTKHLLYIIESVKVYYKTQKSLFKSEILILKYFDELTHSKNKQAVFLKFQKELKITLKEPNELGAMFYFEIETYVNAKIKGVSMASLMKYKYAKAWLN